MRKKLITGLLALLLVFSSGLATYASDYQILNPNRKAYSTRNKVVLLNGRAPTNTRVIIDLYGTTDLTRRNFNLGNLPRNRDYIRRSSTETRSGNMGYFQKELNLTPGVNKINVSFRSLRGGQTRASEEIIVYVYDHARLMGQRTLIRFR